MSIKTQGIGILFVTLAIILTVNPKIVNNIYGYILGRLFLISVVVFFAMNNVTLGLLLVLVIISGLNQFGSFVEGMENGEPTTTGEENTKTEGEQKVLTSSATEDAKKKISELKQNISEGTQGIDKEDIKLAIMSKDSKQIPVDSNMNSSSEVNASSTGMLNPSSETLEGFSSYSKLY
jgi:hypothetical protein